MIMLSVLLMVGGACLILHDETNLREPMWLMINGSCGVIAMGISIATAVQSVLH